MLNYSGSGESSKSKSGSWMEKVARNGQSLSEPQHKIKEQRKCMQSLCEICSLVWSRNMGTDEQTTQLRSQDAEIHGRSEVAGWEV